MAFLKSFKFWILFLLASYALVGFLILPWFITDKAPLILQKQFDLQITIKKAYINPFTFTLQLDGVELKDKKGKRAITLEQLFIDYELLGLLEKKVLFTEFYISTPKLFAQFNEEGELNLNNLLTISQKGEEVKSSEPASLPVIFLEKFHIDNGRIFYEDLRKKSPFSLELGPYDFNVHDISTAPGKINSHNFQTSFKDGGELFWEGGMSIKPLKLYGELNIKDLLLPKIYAYALPKQKALLQSAYLSLYLPYNIDLTNDLELLIQKANLSLSNLRIADKISKKTLIKMPLLAVKNIDFSWPEQNAVIGSLELKQPQVYATLSKDKEIDLLKTLIPNSSKKETKEVNTKETSNFSFLLKDIFIKNGGFDFTDNSLKGVPNSNLSEINLHVKQVSSDKTLPILANLKTKLNKNAQITLEGSFLQKGQKLTSTIDINNFDIDYYAPYANPYTNAKIQNGSIDLNAKVQGQFGDTLKLQSLSDLKINDLKIDSPDKKPLVSWKQLLVNSIDYTHEPMKLHIGSLELKQPHARVHIAKDGSTNFANLVKAKVEENKKSDTDEKETPLQVRIGPMKLIDGSSEFSDLSLPFPFKTNIHDLKGDISTLDFATTEPSRVSLDGKIDKYGYANISGELYPLKVRKRADINVLFKNINLPSLTPYSGKFVGYAIKSGKLSMNLNYDIKNATLKGENKINIDTLTLGEKIESPEAVNLPLELAIALLKDSNGQIDIDLPVRGDMNNPEFSYGSVIWRAVGNLITGIVTAPFRFLGNMLGIDGKKLKNIEFASGDVEIINTEHEKLANLEKILGKRPQLKLSIQASYDPILDTKALQEEKLREILQKIQKELKAKDKESDHYSLALKKLFLQSYKKEKYEELQKNFIDKKTEKFDQSSFNEKIRKTLAHDIKIEEESLQKLAKKRAEAIKETLQTQYKIDPNRVIIQDDINTEAKDTKWVALNLEIKT